VASTVTELARQASTYHFGVFGPVTFYLQTEHADVSITRWTQPKIEVQARLEAAFGWRVAADQDEAGVYVVARRRPLVGAVSRAAFSVFVPLDTYLILKLMACRAALESLDGTLHLPPPNADGQITLRVEPAS
jgi:hypothetical protein